MFGKLWRKGDKGNEGESKQERGIKNSLDCMSLFSVIPRLPSKAKFLFLPYNCEIRK